MLIVRNSFVAKPGQASKLAAMFKDLGTAAQIPKYRVMTDVTGEFNRVFFEFEVASIAEFEQRLHEYSTNPIFREKMQGYTDLWITGSREILRVM